MTARTTGVQYDTDTEAGWTHDQHSALTALDVPDAYSVRALLFEVCKRTGLDPFARQVYINKDTKKPETTIDGFRSVAESTGVYRGQIGPQWCGDDGKWVDVWTEPGAPHAARVGVLRSDFDEPLYAVALYREYVATEKAKENPGHRGSKMIDVPTAFWQKMPVLLTAKCAEALALRRAFPKQLGGLYTNDEMQQAENGKTARDSGRDFEQIDNQRNAGEPRTPRRLDPQKGAEKAHAAELPEQVYELYSYAKGQNALAQPITDPATGEQWLFGVYLLRTAASKSHNADVVRAIREEAAPVLDRTIPGGDGTTPFTLGGYLDACITALTPRQDAFGTTPDAPDSDAATGDGDREYTEAELYAALGSGHPDVEAHAAALLTARGRLPIPPGDWPTEYADDGNGHFAEFPVGAAGTEECDGEDADWGGAEDTPYENATSEYNDGQPDGTTPTDSLEAPPGDETPTDD